ncbi:MAG: glycosyltransferase [Chitinophagaceae bacterium]|nr:MAG: glycosyltransferase [Chitinophagaceae bacterium]
MIWLIIIYTLLILYGLVIIFYTIQWIQSKNHFLDDVKKPQTQFTILIPARNEEQNIEALLHSITQNQYPKEWFEVIVIDDHSTDNTFDVVNQFIASSEHQIRIKKLEADHINSYKKKAIEMGISLAKNDWIICTDADCIVPQKWLQSFDLLIQNNKVQFIAAPVAFTSENSLLSIFQNLDFITLQGITAASVFSKTHNMCNGANVAYSKNAFHQVGGFAGIDHIASGDDLLLMHKIDQAFPNQTLYLKSTEAIVKTIPPQNWKSFINQRIRWASKSTQYDDKRIFWVLIVVYFLNLGILSTAILSIFNSQFLNSLLILILLKTVVEFPFVFSVAHFFKKSKLMIWFLFFQPLHITYTVVAGFLGVFGSYQWKGRTVK